MRAPVALTVCLLVILAGCSAPLGSSGGGSGSAGTTENTGTTATATSASGTETSTGTGAMGTEAASNGTTTSGANDLADPPSDRLGWENGVWYNESLSVDAGNGLDADERAAVVNRTMARIEVVRGLEYDGSIPVSIISRSEYQQQASSGDVPPEFRTFDNAKFEAMFFVGEGRNSLTVQDQNRGSSVLGYYSPTNDSIVIVSDSRTPQLNASTLAHELTHALQDQQFDLTDDPASTREAYNARNGLIEGEANFVQRKYEERFDDTWEVSGNGGSGEDASSSQLHYGIYFLEFFPYSDGPGFVADLYNQGGWQAVNAAHENIPASTEQVIYPELYEQDAPTNVTVRDTSTTDWERVRPEAPRPGQQQPNYAVLGQSALSSMLAYTLLDVRSGMTYNQSTLVQPNQVINQNGQQVNSSDPLNYDLPATQGWDGDKMYVYENSANETGYVWKLVWDSPAQAQEFAAAYEDLLSHWGGTEVSESAGTSTWEIEEASPFTDAFRVQVEGDTVTITNAPTVEDVENVHSG